MKVSAIIPTYNRFAYICRAIDSVLSQTHPVDQIIVVDDGSTDGTADTVRKLAHGSIRYFRHHKNRGPAAARNTGLRAATGDCIAFLDSDDLWKPDKVHADIAFLQAHREVDGVFTDVEMHRGSEVTPSVARIHAPFRALIAGRESAEGIVLQTKEMYMCLLEAMPVKTPAMTIRQSAIRDVGLFREDFVSGEDWEFLLRFSRSHRWGYIDRPLVIQHVMADSTLKRHSLEDARGLMERFVQEKHALHGDAEAMRAVRRGIANCGKRLGWQHLQNGNLGLAAAAYLKAFHETRDMGVLLRLFGVAVPIGMRKQVKELIKRAAAV